MFDSHGHNTFIYILFELSCRLSHCRLAIQRHTEIVITAREFKFPSFNAFLFVFVRFRFASLFFFCYIYLSSYRSVSGDRINKFRAIWTTTSSTMMISFHAIFITIGSSWWQFYFVTRAFPRHLLLLLFTINTHKSLWTIWIIIRV